MEKKLYNNIPKYATASPLTRAQRETTGLRESESMFEDLLQSCLTWCLALDREF